MQQSLTENAPRWTAFVANSHGSSTGDNACLILLEPPLTFDVWAHIVFTYRDTATQTRGSLWVDGVEVSGSIMSLQDCTPW